VSPLGWAAFVIAGAVGAPLRYLVDVAVTERTNSAFPWATLIINASGSFLLGLITGLGLHHGLAKTVRVVAGVGFCGAYTTFSTFSFETVRLLDEGAPVTALANTVAMVLSGGLAAAAGLAVATLGS
jgi:CrcB protein